MLKWPRCRLIAGIDPITNGTALHQNDRMMTVLAHRGRSQAKNIPRFDLSQHLFKTEGGEMMAFVHDDLAVSGHQIIHHMFAAEALYYRHVDQASRLFATASNLSNRLDRKVQKNRQSLSSLVEQLTPMDQDQCIDLSRRDHPRRHYGFTERSRGR